MKKTLRSIVSVILVLTMSLGIFSVAASADEPEPTKSYVALGDSFSQGYAFKDYKNEKCGFGGASAQSYINAFAEHLGEDYALTDLTIQGMRPAVLYGILVPDLMVEPDWNVTKCIENYTNVRPLKTTAAMTKTYADAIANADVITYDLGMSDFGIFALDTIRGLIAGDISHDDVATAAQFINKLDIETAAFVSVLRDTLHGVLDGSIEDIPVADIIETLVYTYAQYIVYFEKTVDYILTVNSDVELIVLPLFNPIQNLYLDGVEGLNEPINVSLIFDLLFESINVYMTTNDYASLYKYAYYAATPTVFADELLGKPENVSNDLKYNIAKQLINIIGASNFTGLLNTLNTGEDVSTLLFPMHAEWIYNAYTEEEPKAYQVAIVSGFDKILDVLADAMEEKTFSVDYMEKVFAGEAFADGIADILIKEELTVEDKLLLQAMIKFTAEDYAYGLYPAPDAMPVKVAALKKAHESKFSADGTVLNIIIDTTTEINGGIGALISELIDTILFNNRSLLAKITDFLRNIINVINQILSLDFGF